MKLFGNRRRAAHTKKSALSRGTRTALIAAVIVLAVAGSAFAAWNSGGGVDLERWNIVPCFGKTNLR